MKIAVAYGNGRISPVFDTARELVLIDFEGEQELQRTRVAVSGPDPFDRVRSVRRSGAGVLLCGALSRGLETALIGAGVKVCSFVRGELDAVVSAYLAGRLEDARYQMPGKPKPAEEKNRSAAKITGDHRPV
jgi:predicted Fe-Mo cluster-binding NifX family protein